VCGSLFFEILFALNNNLGFHSVIDTSRTIHICRAAAKVLYGIVIELTEQQQ
jgi:hypothetical protein